ncbi:MAG: Hsp20/alpha crystallin family protein [Cyclobacteriaceae bacterium]|nr:Hsp20/alpha crystallin family protein [Cyclobacteriaceae bacterium]
MNIIRYSPSDYVPTTFSSLIDRFFNDRMTRTGGSAFVPRVDVVENQDTYELHLAAPGMNKEDFQIELKENYLTVSGERKFSNEKREKNYHAIETEYGAFSRSFYVPENIDASRIQAKYVNGILELTLPKDEKKALKSTIKVS